MNHDAFPVAAPAPAGPHSQEVMGVPLGYRCDMGAGEMLLPPAYRWIQSSRHRKPTSHPAAAAAATSADGDDFFGAEFHSLCCVGKPFLYRPRYFMYWVLFVCSCAVFFFSCLNVAAPQFVRLTQFYSTRDPATNQTIKHQREIVGLSLFSSCRRCKHVTGDMQAAMDPHLYPHDTALLPQPNMRTAGYLTVLVLLLSAALSVLSVVTLYAMQRQLAQWEERQQREGEAPFEQRQREEEEEALAAAAGRRRALGRLCLLLVAACLTVTSFNIPVAVRATWDLYDAQGDYSAKVWGAVDYRRVVVLANRPVWTHVPNIITLFILFVMMCVPALSGIMERP